MSRQLIGMSYARALAVAVDARSISPELSHFIFSPSAGLWCAESGKNRARLRQAIKKGYVVEEIKS